MKNEVLKKVLFDNLECRVSSIDSIKELVVLIQTNKILKKTLNLNLNYNLARK